MKILICVVLLVVKILICVVSELIKILICDKIKKTRPDRSE